MNQRWDPNEMNQEERRSLGLVMLRAGVGREQVARVCKVSVRTAGDWARLLAKGIDPARNPPRGRPRNISALQLPRLRQLLLRQAGGWNVDKIAALVSAEFGVNLSRTTLWRTLRRAGLVLDRDSGRLLRVPRQAGAAASSRRPHSQPAPRNDARPRA